MTDVFRLSVILYVHICIYVCTGGELYLFFHLCLLFKKPVVLIFRKACIYVLVAMFMFIPLKFSSFLLFRQYHAFSSMNNNNFVSFSPVTASFQLILSWMIKVYVLSILMSLEVLSQMVFMTVACSCKGMKSWQRGVSSLEENSGNSREALLRNVASPTPVGTVGDTMWEMKASVALSWSHSEGSGFNFKSFQDT